MVDPSFDVYRDNRIEQAFFAIDVFKTEWRRFFRHYMIVYIDKEK